MTLSIRNVFRFSLVGLVFVGGAVFAENSTPPGTTASNPSRVTESQKEKCSIRTACADGHIIRCTAEGPQVTCDKESGFSVTCQNYGTNHVWHYTCN